MNWKAIFGSYESKIRATLLGILLAALVVSAGTSIMLYYAHKTIEAELLSPLYESLDAITIDPERAPMVRGAVFDLSHGLDTHLEFALADTIAGAPGALWDQMPPAAREKILAGHTAFVRRQDGPVTELRLSRIVKQGDDVRVVSVGRQLVAYSRFLTIELWNTISRTAGFLLLVAAIFLVTREMTRPFRRLRTLTADAKLSLNLQDRPADEDWEEVLYTFRATIAKLKASQQELHERYVHSEAERVRLDQFNQQVIQSIPAGLLAADPHGVIVQHNPSLLQLPGARAPHSDETLREYFTVWPEFSELFADSPSYQRSDQTGECRIMHEGEAHFLEYDVLSVPGGGTLVLITDRTQLRRLESLVAQRARMAALGETAAGLAHELRNAMGAIVGYARLVAKSEGGAATDVAERIKREAGEMEAMLQRFLEVARPAEIQREEVNSYDLLDDLTVGIGSRLVQAGIEFSVSKGRAVTVRVDPVWIKRAVTNLVDNAQQHLGDHGTIAIEARAAEDTWYLTVEDDGPGIAPEWREKIFAPFVTSRPGGTGLGLALVQKVMTAHEGTVELMPCPTGGSRFVLTFPRAVVEQQAAGIPASA